MAGLLQFRRGETVPATLAEGERFVEVNGAGAPINIWTGPIGGGTPVSLLDTKAGLAGGADANFTAMPQVSGNPIVESGSNSDGEWTRYADGTQMCRVEGVVITLTSGAESAFLTWVYPVAFSSRPFVTATLACDTDRGDATTQAGFGFRNYDADALATEAPRVWIRNSSSATADYRDVQYAEGEWL